MEFWGSEHTSSPSSLHSMPPCVIQLRQVLWTERQEWALAQVTFAIRQEMELKHLT